MTGRHVARHKAPRSVRRSASNAAADACRALPGRKVLGVAAVLGTTGAVVGMGVFGTEPATGTTEASVSPRLGLAPAAVSGSRHVAQPVTDDTGSSGDETVVVYDAVAPEPDYSRTSTQSVSRSSVRPALGATETVSKVDTDAVMGAAVGGNLTDEVAPTDPKQIALSLMGTYGWDSSEFGCLDSLWTKESGWQVDADNPTSSAYGIPQALPGEKMAMFGDDWATNPETQVKWGLYYINASYGSPCAAWAHSQATDWY